MTTPLLSATCTAFAAGGDVLADPGAMEGKHFHPKGKMPSKYTIEALKHQLEIRPLTDKKDFKETDKGFIDKPDFKQIPKDGGGLSWDLGKFDFLIEGKDFDSIHPFYNVRRS